MTNGKKTVAPNSGLLERLKDQSQTGLRMEDVNSLVTRIAYALDVPVPILARQLDVSLAELEELEQLTLREQDPEHDDLWWRITELIDIRLGLIMAAKSELNRLLTGKRAERAVRIASVRERPGKRSPRSL